ncbi:MAG: MerR family transcriptional regulator [Coriobacteriaceae bacterium]|jgi:DNA-binding transcriptional MerR regulator|nr:MerR family transcriptional regulator [Coriobacteriaceae bacterium]
MAKVTDTARQSEKLLEKKQLAEGTAQPAYTRQEKVGAAGAYATSEASGAARACGNEASYSVHQLAALSGVSPRTLHYYDEKGLLKPQRKANGYRSYGHAEVERLQQILLYREVGMGLGAIKQTLDAPSFQVTDALRQHLLALKAQHRRLAGLIDNVEKTLAEKEGNLTMEDAERFEGFKKQLLEENEERYGAEIREKYGDSAVEGSNAKFAALSEEEFERSQELDARLKGLLQTAMDKGDPQSSEAQEACDLHRQWLCIFWADGMYHKAAHRAMGDMYVADERFRGYYDSIRPGMAAFFRDALNIYTAE